ncbi:MAG: RNA 2',3'-cyclic phosphodiesterase [Gemmatimonadales bacterium]|nr:RNA 2',3'-cyclic phosphodiesterase [Gemmatimonadales bacterium]
MASGVVPDWRSREEPEPLPERLFLAVPLDPATRRAVAARLPRALPGRRTDPAGWHLTLRFLGDTSRFRRERLLDVLDDVAWPAPFTLRFGSLGAFPSPARARVLWLGVDEGTAELAALAREASAAALDAGFAAADRFEPHLTLARFGEPTSVEALVRRAPPVVVPLEVPEVVLYRSERSLGPARYHVVARFPLDG